MAVKIRALAKFPARAVGDSGMQVVKTNGVWYFRPDFGSLATIPDAGSVDTTNDYMIVYRSSGTPVNMRVSFDILADAVTANLSAALSAISALTPAADSGIYYTSGTAAALFTITAQARALLDDATAGDQLTTLGISAFAQTVLDDADAAAFRTTVGSAASGANTDITSVYLNNTGLKIKDTNASHGLSIAPGSDLTADRTLTVTTGDSSRTLTITGNPTINQDTSTTGNPQFATVELGAATDTTLSRVSAGVAAVEGSTVLTASVTAQLAVGFTSSSESIGTISSGTVTPNPATLNFKHYTNNGAHTLAPPSASGQYTIIIQITNGASAGTITTSGFTKVTGSFTTTRGAPVTFPFPTFSPFVSTGAVAITYVTAVTDATDLTTYNGAAFTGVNIGTAAADRVVVVGIIARRTAAATLDSITIGGSAATIVANANNASSGADIAALAALAVSSGTTANIFPTFSNAMARCGLIVWRMTGASSATAFATATDATMSSGVLSASANVPANGGAIAVAWQNGSTPTWTWTGVTEDVEQAVESANNVGTGASLAFAAAQTPLTVTATSSDTASALGALAVASWGP